MALQKRKALVIYEDGQYDTAVRMQREEGGMLVPLTAWLENRTIRDGHAYLSGNEFLPDEAARARMTKDAQRIAREWYRVPEAQGFAFQSIRYGEVVEPMFEYYVAALLFYAHILRALHAAHPDVMIVVFQTTARVSSSLAALEVWTLQAPMKAATMLAANGVPCAVVGGDLEVPAAVLDSIVERVAFGIFNAVVSLIPRKRHTLLVSDYWGSIAPALPFLPQMQLWFTDLRELRSMRLADIFARRIRFSPLRFHMTGVHRRVAQAARDRSAVEWQEKKESFRVWFEAQGKGLAVALLPVAEYVVTRFTERIVADIGAIDAMLERVAPDAVLLRASIGGRQHHFFLLAKRCEAKNIPAIELQHAGAVYDADSVHARLEARYLASFGARSRSFLHDSFGVDGERVVPVGSVRMETLAAKPLLTSDEREEKLRSLKFDPKRPTVFIAMPWEHAGPHYLESTSYDIRRIFDVVAKMKIENPKIQALFKFRGGALSEHHRAYAAAKFDEGVALLDSSNAYELMQLADVVVSPDSTIMYEAFFAKKPLVLYPWASYDPQLSLYSEAGELATGETLNGVIARLVAGAGEREKLTMKGAAYVKKYYQFDGHAGERIAALIRRVSGD